MTLSILLCIGAGTVLGQSKIDEKYANKIADAIYKAEGGAKTRYPYGIKSINTKGNKEYARQICLNTIRNNYIRWQKFGTNKVDFITFLGNRFCPVGAVDDPTGLNKNWVKNVESLVNK